MIPDPFDPNYTISWYKIATTHDCKTPLYHVIISPDVALLSALIHPGGIHLFGKNFVLNEQTLNIFKEIGRHMPGGFFIYKAGGNEDLIYVNDAVISLFGCDDLDDFISLTGNTFKGMLHPDDYANVTDSVNDQIRMSSENIDHVLYRIIRKDGQIRWIDDYGHYTETDNYGGIYYVFIADVTEQHEEDERNDHDLKEKLISEQVQRKQQDKMITALASDYRSVYHIDLDRNEGVCYRSDPDDHKQTDVGIRFPYLERFRSYAEHLVDESYREGFLKFIEPDNVRAGLSDKPIIAYRYLVHRDGKDYYEMIRMAGVRHPLDRDDHIVHAVGLGLTNIDAEMRDQMAKSRALAEALEAAQEANRAKTAFLSSMSHEIRTPMNAIIGLDSLALQNSNLDDDTRQYLEKIGASAGHLLDLINDILDMSRIESGKVVLKNEAFSLESVLDQINVMVTTQCNAKGLDYKCRINCDVSDLYIGDEMKLKQILINILSNAIKFTDAPGSVTLTVDRTAVFEDKSTFRFSIKDTGIGMDSSFIPKVFDTFTQEFGGSTNKYGSTGLGMAITKNIVEIMNGTISVESQKGVGSEFTVVITFNNCDRKKDDENPAAKCTKKGRASLDGKNILLAEDVIINAEIIKEILGIKGATIDHAENGKLALDKFSAGDVHHYDAILMDIRMPVMDGLETARKIRALDRADAKTIPIIALTANAFDEDVQRSLQVGMNAHLSKPIEPDRLYQTLEELIWESGSAGYDHNNIKQED